MVLVGVAAHALEVVVGHILVAAALATGDSTVGISITALVLLEGVRAETSIGLDNLLALHALVVIPGHLYLVLFRLWHQGPSELLVVV